MALLDQSDVQSQAWIKVKAHLTERLQDHRIKNDGRLNEIETATVRGRIAEILYALSLSDRDRPT